MQGPEAHCRTKRLKKYSFRNGFSQHCYRARGHRLRLIALVGECRYEDDGQPGTGARQLPLEFKPAYVRHQHVEDHAGDLV